MAILNSFEKDKSLIINPIRYQYKNEEWVTCEIVFKENNSKILWTVESILQDYELKHLGEAVMRLLEHKLIEYKSDFLEPNLKLTIKVIEREHINILADYVEGFDYENRENEKNYHKRIDFLTDRKALEFFINELESELQNISRDE